MQKIVLQGEFVYVCVGEGGGEQQGGKMLTRRQEFFLEVSFTFCYCYDMIMFYVCFVRQGIFFRNSNLNLNVTFKFMNI